MVKISVQVCCYNSEKYLEQTLNSIAEQSFKDWELVIVNDGSTDQTETIIKNFLKTGLPVNYYYQKNKGFAAARNKAVELSRGEWIAILDHDDTWYPQKLTRQYQQTRQHPEAKLFFSNSEWFNNQGEVIRKTIENNNLSSGIIKDAFHKLITYGCFIDSETVLINKAALIKCGGFDEKYAYIVDYDAFLKLANHYSVYYEREIFARWRVHPHQATQKMQETMYNEYIRLFQKIIKSYPLPAKVKKSAQEVIFLNFLKQSALHLQRGSLVKSFTNLFQGLRETPSLAYICAKITKLARKYLFGGTGVTLRKEQ